jgi:hypothetical protein
MGGETMGQLHLFYNPSDGSLAADIVGSLQKQGTVASPSLGEIWDFTNKAWGTFGSIAYADRTIAMPAQTAGFCVGYYAVADFDTDFTGNVVFGAFDNTTPDAAAPLFTEILHVRRGVPFDFVIAEDRTNQDISRVFIFEISKRQDGTYAAKKPITISTSDDFDFSFSLPSLVPSNVHVVQIQEITVSPTGTLAIEKKGPQGAYPILSLDGGQTAGTTYTVSCVAIMNTGDQYKCQGTFACVS